MREKITNLSKVHKGKPQIDALLNLFSKFFFHSVILFYPALAYKNFSSDGSYSYNKSNEKLLHTFSIYLIFLTTIIITLPQLVLTHLLSKYGTEALSLMSPFIFSLTFCSCECVCVSVWSVITLLYFVLNSAEYGRVLLLVLIFRFIFFAFSPYFTLLFGNVTREL